MLIGGMAPFCALLEVSVTDYNKNSFSFPQAVLNLMQDSDDAGRWLG